MDLIISFGHHKHPKHVKNSKYFKNGKRNPLQQNGFTQNKKFQPLKIKLS